MPWRAGQDSQVTATTTAKWLLPMTYSTNFHKRIPPPRIGRAVVGVYNIAVTNKARRQYDHVKANAVMEILIKMVDRLDRFDRVFAQWLLMKIEKQNSRKIM
jgi:hypothetical protein